METWETLTMSRKEVPRAGLLKAALAGRISNTQGARALELSVRQFQRVKRRFATEGAPGLPHRLRGRPSPRRLGGAVLARAAWGLRETYAGLNDCHVTEKLQEVEGLRLSRSSVRRLRRALGLPPKRRRRGRSGRTRRTPAAQRGALVQLDASQFAWLEDRGPHLALHGAIDDATGAGLALWFRPTEDLHGYVTLLQHLCTTAGLPLALYGDRLGVFVRNDAHWTLAEELAGAQAPTHFGRILQDLGIGFIAAHSPQAKGRIERFWQTLQDRLVSELRLRGIVTLEAANAFLPTFLPRRPQHALRAPARGSPRRLAPAPARSHRRAQLSVHAPRGPRQHRPPRPPLGATAPPPLVRGAARGSAGVPRRPAARVRGRRLSRHPARPAGVHPPSASLTQQRSSSAGPRRVRSPSPARTDSVALRVPSARPQPPVAACGALRPLQSGDDILTEQLA
jgi:transposase